MKKPTIALLAMAISFSAFYLITSSLPRLSPPMAGNCSDVQGLFETCARRVQLYGLPFVYATGYTSIPGPDNVYKRDEIDIPILIADYLVVVGLPAVLVYLIAGRRRRAVTDRHR